MRLLPKYTPCLFLLASLLQACSGGSGGGASEREVDLTADVGSSDFVYAGPVPASDEIRNFKLSFYDALATNDRCGDCHTPGGSGTVHFVDQTDVNRAWQQARSVVNLEDPAASELVKRVENGHNCWLGQDQTATCATTLTSYVERWAADAIPSSSTVQLLPRVPSSPDGTRVMPARLQDAMALGLALEGSGDLLDLLQSYCSGCHSDTAPVPQVPYFASDDSGTAYDALRTRVDLVEPGASRLVMRVFPESHNCWSDCEANAATLEDAVRRLAEGVPVTSVDPALLISRAQVLESDGIVATSGGRFENNLIARWEFREGSGTTTADTSGITPEITLSLSGQYSWMGSWGIRFTDGKAQGGVSDSAKLFDRITATGEYTIEAWVAPANVTQEEAWIVGYAGGPDNGNMQLRQSLYNYEAFNRSSVTEESSAGEPALTTSDAAELAQASLQHVVVTFDPLVGRQIYVNGVYSGDMDAAGGGLLNNWNESFALVLGNTTSGARPWSGAMRMVAIHNIALTPEQVVQNFDVGVGPRYYLMFSVAEMLDREGVCHVIEGGDRTNYCYVVFEVSQFDDASYLFNRPFFANINPDGDEVEFDLRGILLGINGKLAQIGQGFVNVDTRVNRDNSGGPERPLAIGGSIIPLENGSERDVFFLAFDSLGGKSGSADDGEALPFQYSLSGSASPDVGVRTFDEVNATLSVLTGVPTAHASISAVTGKTVAETFSSVRRALPGGADFQAFMSSHQMAATQLAAAYCDALVQDVGMRERVFPAPPVFDFSRPVADPGIDWRNHVIAPLVDRAANTGLLSSDQRGRILDEVELLITDQRDLKPYILLNGTWVSNPDPGTHTKRDGLIYCEGDALCPASRTADVVKAACTAVLGSALVLMQ